MNENPALSPEQIANNEKERAATASVVWAVVLTVSKAIVGFLTGSLGIGSEALHSSLDLIAAFVTWFAVRVAGRPADDDHQYGHSKIESLSALVELLLLMITCFWIILEAVERLDKPRAVEVNVWSFAVMAASIGINIWRARDLYRVAEKYQSQALAADALHFSSDVVSSLVVIVGLVFAGYGYPRADPIAALGVALIVMFAMYGLGREALDVLMDKAPEGMPAKIRALVERVPGVASIEKLRVRAGGGQHGFADITILVERDMAFEEAHGVSHQVERAVRDQFPHCQTQVHIEPAANGAENLLVRIRRAALCLKGVVNLHSLEILDEEESWKVYLHLEVDESMLLSEAHSLATELEKQIKNMESRIARVTTHIEPAHSSRCTSRDVTESFKKVFPDVEKLGEQVTDLRGFHNFRVSSSGNVLTLEFHVRTSGAVTIVQAHKSSVALEEMIRKTLPQFNEIIIHTEPSKTTPA